MSTIKAEIAYVGEETSLLKSLFIDDGASNAEDHEKVPVGECQEELDDEDDVRGKQFLQRSSVLSNSYPAEVPPPPPPRPRNSLTSIASFAASKALRTGSLLRVGSKRAPLNLNPHEEHTPHIECLDDREEDSAPLQHGRADVDGNNDVPI